MKQIGRSVYHEKPKSKYDAKLSILRSCKKIYYKLRTRLITRRLTYYGSYSGGYQRDLFNAAAYKKQSYLYKIEALYSKQELRDYERRVKRG